MKTDIRAAIIPHCADVRVKDKETLGLASLMRRRLLRHCGLTQRLAQAAVALDNQHGAEKKVVRYGVT